MRKRLTFALLGAVIAAILAAGTASAVLNAPNGNVQDAVIQAKPSKLGKKIATPITLDVLLTTGSTTNPFGKPVPVTQAIIDFDKNTAIFAKGYPTCEQGQLESVSTEVGLEACKKAQIGGGEATVLLPSAKGVQAEKTIVTAYNGAPQGSNPVVLLQVYGQAPIQTTQVLVGVVSRYEKEGYGPRLTVAVPPLAGGEGALTEFHATIFKKFAYKGEQRSYVSAKCPNTKKLKARAQLIYRDGESLTPEVTQKCSQKPEPKKKKGKK